MDNFFDLKIKEENKKIKRVRIIVDFTCQILSTQSLTLNESFKIIEGVKKTVLSYFPDGEKTFNLIYVPRFLRIIAERWGRTLNEMIEKFNDFIKKKT